MKATILRRAMLAGAIATSGMIGTTAATPAQIMPTIDTTLPCRADRGEFIRCRPITKHAAAPRKTSRTTVSVALMPHPRSSGCRFRRLWFRV